MSWLPMPIKYNFTQWKARNKIKIEGKTYRLLKAKIPSLQKAPTTNKTNLKHEFCVYRIVLTT